MADFNQNKRLKKIITEVYKVSPVEFSKKYRDPKAVKTYNILSERNGISTKMLDEILMAPHRRGSHANRKHKFTQYPARTY